MAEEESRVLGLKKESLFLLLLVLSLVTCGYSRTAVKAGDGRQMPWNCHGPQKSGVHCPSIVESEQLCLYR